MNVKSKAQPKSAARQDGAAMVIALIMLLVLTLLATASARMTILEERMTGNTQDRSVAFQAAEAGLRAGEDQAQVPVLPDFAVNAAGLYRAPDPADTPLWLTVNWASAGDVSLYNGLADAPGSLARATASFLVEELPRVATPGESLAADASVDEAIFFRVTARGVGVSGNAAVTLQSTFKR